MAVQTTSNLTNSIIARYLEHYYSGVYSARVYDQLAVDATEFESPGVDMATIMRSSSLNLQFLSDMEPGTNTISETADVIPQTLTDATVSITPTSRGEALLWSEKLVIEAFDEYTAKAYEKVGQSCGETIELVAQAAATQGTWVERAAARASLDAGTSTHRASDAIFRKYSAKFKSLKVRGFMNDAGEANTFAAIMHDYPFHDICESGNVDSIGLYQDKGIHLNFELAQIGDFRLVVTPFAKVFWSAGIDNATAVAGTLASAASALDKTIVTSSDHSASITAGELWLVGTEETANTHYGTNEVVKVLSASTTTLTIAGEGANGGLRYAHGAGASVLNNDNVFTIVFGGAQSLLRAYDPGTGMYGKVVGPKIYGLLDQFNTLGYKWYGFYNLPVTKNLLRFECSSSYDA